MRDYWLKLWVTKGSYFSKGFPSMMRRKSQPASQPSCASRCNGKEEPFAYSDMDYDLLLHAYRLVLSALCAQWNTSLDYLWNTSHCIYSEFTKANSFANSLLHYCFSIQKYCAVDNSLSSFYSTTIIQFFINIHM